ncbi:hypothetical protein HDU86_000573 [Geranomyces michiganensis]|nr:hypothetical protein HDU86_000573 [Geranomyces michiganensis]
MSVQQTMGLNSDQYRRQGPNQTGPRGPSSANVTDGQKPFVVPRQPAQSQNKRSQGRSFSDKSNGPARTPIQLISGETVWISTGKVATNIGETHYVNVYNSPDPSDTRYFNLWGTDRQNNAICFKAWGLSRYVPANAPAITIIPNEEDPRTTEALERVRMFEESLSQYYMSPDYVHPLAEDSDQEPTQWHNKLKNVPEKILSNGKIIPAHSQLPIKVWLPKDLNQTHSEASIASIADGNRPSTYVALDMYDPITNTIKEARYVDCVQSTNGTLDSPHKKIRTAADRAIKFKMILDVYPTITLYKLGKDKGPQVGVTYTPSTRILVSRIPFQAKELPTDMDQIAAAFSQTSIREFERRRDEQPTDQDDQYGYANYANDPSSGYTQDGFLINTADQTSLDRHAY